MTKIVCITSMNKEYYDQIGKLMIASWDKYWSEDCQLFVYQEDFEITDKNKVRGIDWYKSCGDYHKVFENKLLNIKDINLNIPPILKFAKKGFSWITAMETIDCDYLIWIDADIITREYIDQTVIQKLLPENKLIAFFDTYYQVNPNYTEEEYLNRGLGGAAESGFVIINKKHKEFLQYLENYKKYYNQQQYETYLGQWYDGNICYTASHGLLQYVEDLSKHRSTNKTQTPLNRSWIGKHLYHAKAKLKNDKEMIRQQLELLGEIYE